ncbi:MAG TPA: DUF4118 domain-containing protein [Ramlibacter sp.]|nr:DUF4118 domain-containing protein [Ramlibacter sp.]
MLRATLDVVSPGDVSAAPFSATAQRRVQLLVAGAAIAAATAVCWWLDARMSVAGLTMVYLVAVAACATFLNRTAGVLASLLSVSALNYFFVPPRYTFEIDGAEYWWTLAVLLGVALGLNALIAGLRARHARAEEGETRAARLHDLGESMARCEGHPAVAAAAARWLEKHTGLPCAVFVAEGNSVALSCTCAGDERAFHPQPAKWAIEHGRPVGRGCPDWPDLPLWCAPFSERGATGAVQLVLPHDARPPLDLVAHWRALARQVGLSVERERAAAAARKAVAEAQSEATRNTLLASLSHDLRTPLAAIVGTASALRAQGSSIGAAQQQRLLANLENEARDMTLMADNILQMARLSQPQSQLAMQWESVEELLGTAVERMRRRWEGARIEWRVPAGLPPVRVEAGLIAQVISNLVDNAMRHGGARREVVIQAGRQRNGIFIAVRDHGAGLPESGTGRLFGRFERGSAPRGGTGLGLSICKMVIDAHGGTIEARRCSPGTEFRLDLPVAPAAHTDE